MINNHFLATLQEHDTNTSIDQYALNLRIQNYLRTKFAVKLCNVLSGVHLSQAKGASI